MYAHAFSENRITNYFINGISDMYINILHTRRNKLNNYLIIFTMRCDLCRACVIYFVQNVLSLNGNIYNYYVTDKSTGEMYRQIFAHHNVMRSLG